MVMLAHQDAEPRRGGEDAPARYIGGYRVLRRLGTGGMGTVYEALQEDIGRHVAIKLLHESFHEDPLVIARLFNEARTVNLIRHGGIVSIFEYGQEPDGGAYLVMEYLEGEALSRRLHRCGRLALAGVRLCRQVASALAVAHQHNVIHRDLKPDNIMIVAEPEIPGGERAKLLDFGIAKLTRAQDGVAEDLRTRAGQTMGTPTYMSPEQCRGASDLDGKTDVYSLGAVLYQVLGGQPPFQADVPADVMSLHLFGQPRPLHELDPLLPQPLSALVHRMLAKDPSERPAMKEVAAHLQQIEAAWPGPPRPSAPDPAAARPPGRAAQAMSNPTLGTLSRAAGQAGPRPRRRPWAIALGAGGTLLLLGGVGLLSEGGPPAAPIVHSAPAASPPPRRSEVRWRVTSDPPGATLIRDADGAILGHTPWEQVRGAERGALGIILRSAGFADRQVRLDLGRDQILQERLVPLRTTPGPAPGAKAGRPAAARRDRPARPDGEPGRKRVKRNEEIDFFR